MASSLLLLAELPVVSGAVDGPCHNTWLHMMCTASVGLFLMDNAVYCAEVALAASCLPTAAPAVLALHLQSFV